MAPTEIVAELQTAIGRASELLSALSAAKPSGGLARGGDGSGESETSSRGCRKREADLTDISLRLVDAEHQRGRLMNLYVATYQLHATMDLDEVKETIAEIARDLLGAEQFVLLLREGDGAEHEIALSAGSGGRCPACSPARSIGVATKPSISRCATVCSGRRGPTVEGPSRSSRSPCRELVGAIVILKLFDHKPALTRRTRTYSICWRRTRRRRCSRPESIRPPIGVCARSRVSSSWCAALRTPAVLQAGAK